MSKKAVKQSVKLLSNIRKEKIASVKKCLAKGADLSYVDPATGFSALHLCASLDAHSCAALLLEAHADPNLRGGDERTPLHTAVVDDSLMTFRLLVDAPSSNVNLVDKHDKSPLTLSILYQREHYVAHLFQQPRLDVLQKDSKQQSALHHACKVGYHRCINQLLAAGLDLNDRNSNGNTPLHLAAIGGFSGCVAVLLTRGADGSITNSSGQTAAALAASMGYDNIVPLLRDSQEGPGVPAAAPEEHARVSRRRSRSMGSVLAGMTLTPAGTSQAPGALNSSAGAALPPPPQRLPSITPAAGFPPPIAMPPPPLSMPPPPLAATTDDLPPPPTHTLLSPRQSRMSIRVAAIEVPDVLPPPRSTAVPASPRTAAALPPAIGAQPTRSVQAPTASDARVSTPIGLPTRQRSFTTSCLPSDARHTIAAQPHITCGALLPPPIVRGGSRGRGLRGRGMPGRAPSGSPRAPASPSTPTQRPGLAPAASLPVLPGMRAPLTPPPQVSRGRRPPAPIPRPSS